MLFKLNQILLKYILTVLSWTESGGIHGARAPSFHVPPTRVAKITTETSEQKISKTLIDHFSSTNPKHILVADVIKTGMVNHYLVYGIRKINTWRRKGNKRKIIESRNMNKYDKMLFRNDVQQIDWEAILRPYDSDPKSMAAALQEISGDLKSSCSNKTEKGS